MTGKHFSISVIWKSDLSDEIIGFLPSCVLTTIWIHPMDVIKTQKKAKWEQYNNVTHCLENILEAIPHKMAGARPPISHLTNYTSKTSET